MLAKAYQAESQQIEAEKYCKFAWSWREDHSGRRGGPSDTEEDYTKEMFYSDH